MANEAISQPLCDHAQPDRILRYVELTVAALPFVACSPPRQNIQAQGERSSSCADSRLLRSVTNCMGPAAGAVAPETQLQVLRPDPPGPAVRPAPLQLSHAVRRASDCDAHGDGRRPRAASARCALVRPSSRCCPARRATRGRPGRSADHMRLAHSLTRYSSIAAPLLRPDSQGGIQSRGPPPAPQGTGPASRPRGRHCDVTSPPTPTQAGHKHQHGVAKQVAKVLPLLSPIGATLAARSSPAPI